MYSFTRKGSDPFHFVALSTLRTTQSHTRSHDACRRYCIATSHPPHEHDTVAKLVAGFHVAAQIEPIHGLPTEGGSHG